MPDSDPTESPATSGAAPTDRTSNLVAIVFDDPLQATEGVLAAARLVQRERARLEDVALIRKEGERVRVQETRDTSWRDGAFAGGFWGLAAGLLVAGPIGLAIGALGAAAGGIFAKLRDIGIRDEEMQELGGRLRDGQTAILLLVESVHWFHATRELERFAGALLHTTCDDEAAERIRAALGHDPYAPDPASRPD